ncbi:MAG: TauD/TfdA family dioxygenase [Sphingomonadales bacterium]|nr:TauD/TfdA family dioxygenase [Sphingomonadales bacterium]
MPLPYAVSELAPGLPYGATVSGLRQADLARQEVRDALTALWIDKGVILFRGGDDSREMQCAVSEVFGKPEPFPFKESRAGTDPRLVNIKYFPDDGNAYEVDGVALGGWIPWHTDMVYFARINRGGILRPVQMPATGGETGYADKIGAWNRLPKALQDRIEGLHVVYTANLNYAQAKYARPGSLKWLHGAKSWTKIMERMYEYPRVIHPMVWTQPETGRKVLNVSPGFADGIFEMGGPAGEDLLAEVISYCVDPAEAYFHKWQEGDMVLWDNWRTLHCACGAPADQTRVMERTTIHGDYARGREIGVGTDLLLFDV